MTCRMTILLVSIGMHTCLAAAATPSVTSVLVSHIEDRQQLVEVIEQVGAQAVQIHSEMTPDRIARLRERVPTIRILKSYHVLSSDSLNYGTPYSKVVDAFVADSFNPETNQVGGTGLLHDWRLSAQIVAKYKLPVILAGGLTPENVGAAIGAVRPFGVDVNSGVKGGDGFKDIEMLRSFTCRAKKALRNEYNASSMNE